jgi:hypothetical protein
MEQRCKDTGRPWSFAPPLKKAKNAIIPDGARSKDYNSGMVQSKRVKHFAHVANTPQLAPGKALGPKDNRSKIGTDFPNKGTPTVKPRSANDIRKMKGSS